MRWWDEHLWFVDMYDGKVLTFAPTSGNITTLADGPAILGGLARSADGTLHVVDKSRRRIMALKNGRLEDFADLSHTGASPLNEMVAAPDGSFIVGEYGFQLTKGESFRKGRLFRVSSNGKVAPIPGDFAFPNGMAVIPDSGQLILAESMDRSLTKLSISGNSEAERFVRFDAGHPDGIDRDQNGRIWCALVGTSDICCVDCNGKLLKKIQLPSQPYDVCVAGSPDRLLVATSDAKESDLARNQLPRTGAIYEINL
ncbi:MAG: SMP-30/gluconolactonase/LRE family protein [Pseudomonadota bacterium]|nr:SMP-30/gluconolactonase/LRE family protein [Pseudomonadota bacterium]